ncbi:MAG TPA: PAS domain S-box protein [Myxococcales bacterium]|jgi:PAS domain S-box-containing protein
MERFESATAFEWLIGGGEMGALIRSTDWSRTPLGPRERWPASLRTVVSLVVESPFPMALLWGRELVLVYNDAYRRTAADPHSRTFGRPIRESRPEDWPADEATLAAVLGRGETVSLEGRRFPADGQGRREGAAFTLCCSPVRAEDAAAAGALVTLFAAAPRPATAPRPEIERVEAAAQRDRELFARVIERIPVMVATYDPAVRSFRLNPEFRRVLGWTDEDTRRGDLMALCYPDPRERDEAQRFMASAQPGWREFTVTAKDGSKVASSWANVRLSDDTQVGIGIDLRERQHAEAELRRALEDANASKLLLDGMLENIPIGITLADASEARILAVSRYGCEVAGQPVESVLGLASADYAERFGLLRSDGTPARNEELPLTRAVQRGEYVRDEEWILQRSDGTRVPLLCSAAPIRASGGGIIGGVVGWLDITERKRALQALRESEARLRERAEELEIVMDVAPVAIWVAEDPGCQKIHGNATANRLYEARPGENVSPEALPAERAAHRRVFQEGRELDTSELPMQRAAAQDLGVRDTEVEVLLPSGARRFLFGSSQPLRDSAGRVRGSVGAFVEITERKRAEQELRAERDFTSAVLDTTASLVIVLDPQGRIVRFNKSCEAVSGYREEEMLGKPFSTLIPEDELPALGQVFRGFATGQYARDYENHWTTRDGRRRLLSWSNTAILNEDRSVKFVVGTGIDVTERREAEAALREANERLVEADRRKNEFLAVLSHELRNPLAPIRNSVYILDRAAPGGEQAARARRVIERQAQHMTRLIEDLLDVTRISRGKVHLQRERLDLDALARRTAEDHREVFARSGLDLEVLGAPEPLWVDGDPTRLAQAIGNLLSNSAKFTPRGGRTVLSLEAEADARGGQAVVRVRDNGAGISAQTLSHLFEPFVQATQTIERAGGGLGLGLALVKGLVEMHGGRVWARSEGEGKGSEFTLALPLLPPARPAACAEPAPAAGARARRVLVVEDNLDAAESLREALGFGAHEVAVAHTGPEGLEAARRQRPDVVLCDLGLPGMDGYGVARALRADPDARLRSTFLVALSGYALQEDVAKSRAAGFDRHLAKPPSMESLEKLLAEVPERAAAR